MDSAAVLLDPGLFALREHFDDGESAKRAVSRIVGWGTELAASRGWLRACLPDDWAESLLAADGLPCFDDVKELIRCAGLGDELAAADVHSILNGLMNRSSRASDSLPVWYVMFEGFDCPAVQLSSELPKALSDSTAGVLMAAACSVRNDTTAVDLLRVVTHRTSRAGLVTIKARVQAVDHAAGLDPGAFPQDLEADVHIVDDPSECVLGIPGRALWALAADSRLLEVAIRNRAREIRAASDQSAFSHMPFRCGPGFFGSLDAWQAGNGGRYAQLTLDSCARIVAGLGEAPAPFRVSARGDQVVRDKDQAKAWRWHLTKSGVALRLLAWELADGSLEFANVGGKFELEIRD